MFFWSVFFGLFFWFVFLIVFCFVLIICWFPVKWSILRHKNMFWPTLAFDPYFVDWPHVFSSEHRYESKLFYPVVHIKTAGVHECPSSPYIHMHIKKYMIIHYHILYGYTSCCQNSNSSLSSQERVFLLGGPIATHCCIFMKIEEQIWARKRRGKEEERKRERRAKEDERKRKGREETQKRKMKNRLTDEEGKKGRGKEKKRKERRFFQRKRIFGFGSKGSSSLVCGDLTNGYPRPPKAAGRCSSFTVIAPSSCTATAWHGTGQIWAAKRWRFTIKNLYFPTKKWMITYDNRMT